MLRGLSTVSFYADDVSAAAGWYADLLGVEPYFQRPEEGAPAYIEFRIGDHLHELGLIDRRYASPGTADRPGGAVVFWHVDDLDASVDRLTAMGATVLQPATEHGPGFVTASVVDPFGNILGIMYNAHYLEMLARCGVSAG
ncbi:hypothetical protein SAMN05421678_104358 [Actinopolymorpha cephalotaxi]|uniref:Enzyme related to lactoylglutathione lyase n=1 Tax=Actinopolymorpha cephalotaxi TaxID=504797 RepID=A0A1I2Q150_9ACTN|nr:VOC family protein [Actinopolymorpha cephalotaxi]NYH83395.1 putative enzyme related to lactoylglutathione lyase [Actinopolymorpha cephalotaxi]SFG22092.1 hypothetical protein SAMN05421678_104358 [Actinopolymorpha cephalotaxi]